jgi:hypothetical protein
MAFRLQYFTLGSDQTPYPLGYVNIVATDSTEAFTIAEALPWPPQAVRWSLADDHGRETASHTNPEIFDRENSSYDDSLPDAGERGTPPNKS